MLISLKWLKTYLKHIPAVENAKNAEELSEKLTLSGLEVEGEQAGKDFLADNKQPWHKGLAQGALKDVNADTILDLGITPNRPDALCYRGIARELCALYQTRSQLPLATVRENGGSVHEKIAIDIHDADHCPRYAARVINGVKIQDSPPWLQAQLLASGMRPINNIVDATNYILLDRGHPLHAFDYNKLATEGNKITISVRHAVPGEYLQTLDDQSRKLCEDDLVICDAKGPIALAGVMGGSHSEVSANTTDILLEGAYFDPSVVRKMAKRHGLHSEASQRFEKGVDPNGVKAALDAAAQLIVELAGGTVCRDLADNYPIKINPVVVPFRLSRFAEISGYPAKLVDGVKIRNLFLALGLEAQGKRDDEIKFSVPTHRPDLTREIDLFEEAMRLIGLDKVPANLSFTKKTHATLFNEEMFGWSEELHQKLVGAGFLECINYSFGSENTFKNFGLSKSALVISNPLGEEFSDLRKSLLPGLVLNLKHNLNHGQKTLRLYEAGSVFLGKREEGRSPRHEHLKGAPHGDAFADERHHIAGLICGNASVGGYQNVSQEADFFDLKGELEGILGDMDTKWERPKKVPAYFHPGETAQIFLRKKGSKKWHALGYAGRLHPATLKAMDIQSNVLAFEWEAIAYMISKSPFAFEPIAKFPGSERDLSVVVPEGVIAGEMLHKVASVGGLKKLLKSAEVFDIYVGKGLGADEKSVSIRFAFQSADKTLKDSEVDKAMDVILATLQKDFSARLR